MDSIFNGVLWFFGMIIGFFVGGSTERAHLKSLDEREARFKGVLQMNVRSLPANWSVHHAGMVQGQVVVASDFYKSFLMNWRNFFGGESRTMRVLMQRARREAQLRMVEQAAALGANVVWNVRIETSEVGKDMGRSGAAMAEAFAYGTALKVDADPAKPLS